MGVQTATLIRDVIVDMGGKVFSEHLTILTASERLVGSI